MTPKATADALVAVAPPDRGMPISGRNCPSYVGRPICHPLRVPSGPHRRGDLYRPFGSALDGVAREVAFELEIKSGKMAEVEKARRGLFLVTKSTYVHGSSMAVLGRRTN